MSSERPTYSCRSTWLNGSTVAPNFDRVRRTPFATARTRPCRRVSSVMIRSASPSFWVRSTTPSSRYSVIRYPDGKGGGVTPLHGSCGGLVRAATRRRFGVAGCRDCPDQQEWAGDGARDCTPPSVGVASAGARELDR